MDPCPPSRHGSVYRPAKYVSVLETRHPVRYRDERLPVRSTDVVERYGAFLSYSHALDGSLAPALQTSLEQFGRVWYRRRALRVFRDATNLAATPHLWGAIETALRTSAWFVLLASPEAAQSLWVRREVDWWLTHRPAERLIVAVTSGRLGWDETTGRVDQEHTNALPPVFAERGLPEPLWVDFRALRSADATDPAYQTAVVDIAATLHGVAKDDLIGEQVRRHRRRRRSITSAALLLVALTVISVITAGIAFTQRDRAEEQTRIATSRLLLPQAEALLAKDPRTALHIAEAALAIHPDPETRSGLAQLLTGSRYAGTLSDTTVHGRLAVRKDGALFAAGDADGAITLWDATDPERPVKVGGMPREPTEAVVALAFSADGRLLFSAAHRGAVSIWDVHDPRHPVLAGPQLDIDGGLTSIAIGRGVLAASSASGAVSVWDVTDATQPRSLGPAIFIAADGVFSLAVAPTRPLLAVRKDDAVLLWDVTGAPRPLGSFTNTEPGSSSGSMVFDPAGTTLAVVDANVVLWDVTDPTHPHTAGVVRSGHGETLSDTTTATFAADRPVLATGGTDGSVVLWNIGDRAAITRAAESLSGHTAVVDSLALLAGSQTLISSAEDSTMLLWDLAGTALPRAHASASAATPSQTTAVAASPDGRYVASGADDGSVTLWDLADPTAPRRVSGPVLGHTDGVATLAFSPDAKTLVSGGKDGKVLLWDASTPTPAPTARDATRRPPGSGHSRAVRTDRRPARRRQPRRHRGAVGHGRPQAPSRDPRADRSRSDLACKGSPFPGRSHRRHSRRRRSRALGHRQSDSGSPGRAAAQRAQRHGDFCGLLAHRGPARHRRRGRQSRPVGRVRCAQTPTAGPTLGARLGHRPVARLLHRRHDPVHRRPIRRRGPLGRFDRRPPPQARLDP